MVTILNKKFPNRREEIVLEQKLYNILMIKNAKKEFLLVLFFVVIFIALRSINFIYYLTFGWDQAEHAILALDVFRKKELVLIGPPVTAISFQGRQIFLGPFMTYLMIIFLALGNWNPVIASYIFMISCALMIIPLYYGVKWLLGQKAAWIMVIIYSLLPYYLNYTRFLWNPNFQFALLPALFLFMGLYQKSRNSWFLFITALWMGVLLQLHYQFIISIILITIYYFLVKKENFRKLLIYLGGLLVGFSPIFIFELRHQFYLSKTLLLFYQHINELDIRGNRNHYYLGLSFVVLLGFMGLINNQLKRLNIKVFNIFLLLLFVVLIIFAAQITLIRPATAFWSPVQNWNYLADIKAYNIIKSQNLVNFNVTNQPTDSLALNQKYLLQRDNVKINYDDYWNEKYLFVIDKAGKKNFMDNPGYEVKTFRPFRLLKTWKINNYYNIYLVERLTK
ncbi:hypothetical protein COS51_02615 [Candidatus Roizmanbacteria bacterium CG03_land_8_20_14_0_80_36_21]|uniref:Glycosyltransferase RgtA/B/C/D-like domain-containing protein n=1 Tax=Candidatus Roizmanbacteria bacterium CG10_big_fil_rev_8_21_14_0_10_36_26 TaxID=1974851 RepID=A0A2M8KJZ0_9BACT|nr:MAG: hypothetical protein COS51_02615 [Candidatus Roizmanbacteria bacterium CG03_land_8_20_14_0_80_36_21]PJE60230.1 MAG: hypothetical protein COU86_05410 [Candidatus Roizmanbacteria bacterium CG10_big_fil_rev_8_21_14_0_10_36_26]